MELPIASQDSNLTLLDANHPLLESVQEALKLHLEKQLDDVTTQIVEQENYLKAKKTERQNLGNKVYSLQKDLVSCKNKLEKLNAELKEKVLIRQLSEKELNESELTHKGVKEFWENKKNEELNLQIQIDNYANQLAQLSRTEAEVFTEASVKKTEAEKSGKDSKYLHVEKFRQDIYVLGLSQEIQRLEFNLSGWKSSTEAIQNDTLELKMSLKDAKSYLENINEENQKLVHKWKSSLNALCKRNEGYTKIKQEHNNAKGQMSILTSAISVLNGKLSKIRDENNDLARISSKKQSQIEKLTHEMEKTMTRHEEAQNEFAMYEKTMEETEKSLQMLRKKKVREEINFENVNKRIASAKRSIMKLKSTMANRFSENKTCDTETKRYAEKFAFLQSENRNKEEEVSAVDLKLFSVNMDCSAYESQISTLEEIFNNLEVENNKKDEILTAHQNEMDKIFTDIDKKQNKVAILQKKVSDLLSVTGGKELNPTEQELEKLESEIEEIEQSTIRLQSKWLSAQSQLLALQRNVLQEKTEVEHLRGESAILNARKKRLEDNLNLLNNEKELLSKNLRKLQATKDNLNVLLQKKRLNKKMIESKNQAGKDELAELNQSFELELLKNERELEEIETGKENIDLQIISARDELSKVEKKIQDYELARATLRNERYSEEIQAFTTNIHRKQVYLNQLKREQETLINKMEKAICLRDGLLTKVDIAATNSKKTDSKIVNENQIIQLKRQFNKVSKDLKVYEIKLEEMKKDEQLLQEAVKTEDRNLALTMKEKILKEEQLQTLLQEKYKNTYLLSLKQLKHKYCNDYKKGNYIKRYSNRDTSSEMTKAKEELRDMTTMCDKLVKNFPQTKDCVLKVMALRDCLSNI